MNPLLVRERGSTLGEFRRATRPKSPSVRAGLLPVALATAAGALAAAIELNTRSLWLDEGATFAIASQHGAALWHGIRHDGGNMLAYYLLMHVVIAWVGHAAWVLRLPSVIATAASGGLMAALAHRLFGDRRLATAAGLLTVISVPIVFWGQNARGYALLVTLGIASFLALTAILQTPPERAPSRGAIAAYVLTTLAALYVGYDVALLIPAQLALLPVFRERARLIIGCLAVTLVLCVPLLVLAADRGSGQLFWVAPLDWAVAQQSAVTLLSAGMPPSFHQTAATIAIEAVMAVAVAAALATAGRAAARTASGPRAAGPLLLTLAWALIPTLLALVLYIGGEPIELARVVTLVMPAVALLLAWLLLRPAVTPALGLAGIAVLLALRLLALVPTYGTSPEPWNRATAYVLRASPKTGQPSCVIFYPQDGRQVFDYYLRLTAPAGAGLAPSLRPVLPSLAWSSVKPYVEQYGTLAAGPLAGSAQTCPRVWLLESHGGQAHGTSQSRANLKRYQRLRANLGSLYTRTRARSFGWASKIQVTLFSR